MECAGFLRGLGYDVSLMSDVAPLARFDAGICDTLMNHMKIMGVNFHIDCVPTKFEKLPNGQVKATWAPTAGGKAVTGEFDTVLLAVGRAPDTAGLNLQNAGIETKRDYIVVDKKFKTAADSVYAIGDALVGSRKLTPLAIREGRAVADNLFNNGNVTVNYDLIPTAVFTPIEYGTVGLSEQEAVKK